MRVNLNGGVDLMTNQSMDQWIDELFGQDELGKWTEKQRKIVLAAIETFSEKGYAAASTSEIAQKAGVAEGTIFRHYKTKKDLLLSIIAPVMTKMVGPLLLRDFTKMLDQPYDSYEDFLRALFYNRYAFAKANLPIIKIIVQEVPFHDDLRERFKSMAAEMVISRMRRIIDDYKSKGMLTEQIPTPAMIRFMISTMIGLVASLLLLGPEQRGKEEEELELTIRMLMHGIAAHAETPGPGGMDQPGDA
jgi:AcrR family transcriptional regulator